MEKSVSSQGRAIRVIRWTARILSVLFVAFCLLMFIGESLESRQRPDSPPLTTDAAVQLAIAGISLLGLLLAWKWELAGGIIALAAYGVDGLINYGAFVMFPVAIVAILFLTCWWMSRPHRPSVRSENPKQH